MAETQHTADRGHRPGTTAVTAVTTAPAPRTARTAAPAAPVTHVTHVVPVTPVTPRETVPDQRRAPAAGSPPFDAPGAPPAAAGACGGGDGRRPRSAPPAAAGSPGEAGPDAGTGPRRTVSPAPPARTPVSGPGRCAPPSRPTDAERLRLAQQRAAHTFTAHLVEVLARRRPATHLARLTTPAVHALVTRLALHGDLPGSVGGRPRIGGQHVASPTRGVLEVCARVAGVRRSRALAFRLERDTTTGTWLCTALQIG